MSILQVGEKLWKITFLKEDKTIVGNLKNFKDSRLNAELGAG